MPGARRMPREFAQPAQQRRDGHALHEHRKRHHRECDRDYVFAPRNFGWKPQRQRTSGPADASEASRLESGTCATALPPCIAIGSPYASEEHQPVRGRGQAFFALASPFRMAISLCSLNALRCHRRLLRSLAVAVTPSEPRPQGSESTERFFHRPVSKGTIY